MNGNYQTLLMDGGGGSNSTLVKDQTISKLLHVKKFKNVKKKVMKNVNCRSCWRKKNHNATVHAIYLQG